MARRLSLVPLASELQLMFGLTVQVCELGRRVGWQVAAPVLTVYRLQLRPDCSLSFSQRIQIHVVSFSVTLRYSPSPSSSYMRRCSSCFWAFQLENKLHPIVHLTL